MKTTQPQQVYQQAQFTPQEALDELKTIQPHQVYQQIQFMIMMFLKIDINKPDQLKGLICKVVGE